MQAVPAAAGLSVTLLDLLVTGNFLQWLKALEIAVTISADWTAKLMVWLALISRSSFTVLTIFVAFSLVKADMQARLMHHSLVEAQRAIARWEWSWTPGRWRVSRFLCIISKLWQIKLMCCQRDVTITSSGCPHVGSKWHPFLLSYMATDIMLQVSILPFN